MQGGKRIGSGRKSKAQESKVANLAMDSIKLQHGSLEEGFKWLLNSKESSLIKFVFEHAFGKPVEKVEHTAPDGIQILFATTKKYEPLEDEAHSS